MEGISLRWNDPENRSQCAVVELFGFIDTNTSRIVEDRIGEKIQSGRFWIFVDLSGVDYVSSAGWGAFISLVRRARGLGGDLKLVGLRSDVAEIFGLLQLESVLERYESLEAAISQVPVV